MIPIISQSESKLLKSLITNYPTQLKTKEVSQLMVELTRAQEMEDDAMPADVIRLNSMFEAQDEQTNKIWKFTVTLPEEADVAKQKISVFSPLGVALFGFREGMKVEWKLPGGMKNLTILKVYND